ncbi:hypothetical protein ABTF18_12205 [Acinetobacter baumannii]
MIKNNDLDNLKNLNRNIIQNKPNSAPATPQRLFVYLDGIAQNNDGLDYAYGTNVLTNEKVKVRLTTIDERIDDLVDSGRAKNRQQVASQVTNQYQNSANPRQSLKARLNSNVVVLSFDQSFEIKSEDNYRSYRSHWAESVTSNPSSQLITAPVHIQFVNNQRPFGRVEILEENFKIDIGSSKENIKDAFLKSLVHQDEFSAERSGSLNYILRYKDTNEPIYQGSLQTFLQQVSVGPDRSIRIPADINTTLNNLMSKPLTTQDFTPDDSMMFNHDLNRILVNRFLGVEFSQKLETSNPQLQDNLRLISGKLKKGEIYLDAYSTQNIFFGRDTLKTYQAKANRNSSPLKIYTVTDMHNEQPVYQKGYIHSLVGIDRHSDTLAPFVTFSSTTDPMAVSKKIQDLNINEENLKRTIYLKEEFQKHPLPNSAAPVVDKERASINRIREEMQNQSNNSINFNNI